MQHTRITAHEARIALKQMDGYARMAHIDAHDSRTVLEQFIDQADLLERSGAAQVTGISFRDSDVSKH